MPYRIIPVTSLQQNCSLLWCGHTRVAALVDPGGDAERLLRAIEREGVQVEQILLTHGHVDHVSAAPTLARRLGVPIIGPHPDDAFWLDLLPQQCNLFGLPAVDPFLPDRWLADGERLMVGELALEVLHCPGHTPGHVVFHQRESRTAFVGDVLFAGSIGRTDFPRSDHAQLLRSIRERLWPLGNDVTFIPGHGPTSTFGDERRSNPFVGD